MKEILLTQGYVACVDDEDYDKVAGCKWHVAKRNSINYAAHSTKIDGKRTEIYMHHVILPVVTGMTVDHIDNACVCAASAAQTAPISWL